MTLRVPVAAATVPAAVALGLGLAALAFGHDAASVDPCSRIPAPPSAETAHGLALATAPAAIVAALVGLVVLCAYFRERVVAASGLLAIVAAVGAGVAAAYGDVSAIQLCWNV